MNRNDLKKYFRTLLTEASEADADEAGMRRHLAANKSEVYQSRAQGAAVEVAKIMLKYGLGQPDPSILAKHLLAAYDEHIRPPEADMSLAGLDDEEVGDHSEEYKKMIDSFSPYDK